MAQGTEPAAPALPGAGVLAKARWPLALVLGSWAVLALVALFHPQFDCNRWDNFEYFTPQIIQAHGQWLAGTLPQMNFHQLMGDALIPSGQPGVFYFPYTLGVLILNALALRPERLMAVLWCLHLPWAVLGCFALLRAFGVRPAFAALAAFSASLGGFAVSISLCWIFMLAIFAWFPWILWGLTQVLSAERTRAGGAMACVGLAATAAVGYPQMTIYVWMFALLFLALFGLWVYRVPRRMLASAWPLGAAGLLSAPALLPMFVAIKNSVRAESLGLEDVVARSVSWQALLGWFSPVLKASNDFLPDPASLLGYQGFWVVAALLGAVCLLAWIGRSVFSDEKNGKLSRIFVAMLALAIIFLVLALGKNTFVFPMTYGVPVWSSLRWPFKFFLLSQAALALAAAVGLELCARAIAERSWLRWVIALPPLLALLILLPTCGSALRATAWGWVCTIAGGAAVVLCARCERAWAGRALLLAGVLSAAATLAIAHNPLLKRYEEAYGEAGRETLGLDNAYRVLPLSPFHVLAAPVMQPLGLFHSATVNGYYCATGNAAGLVPQGYFDSLPCQVDGALPYDIAEVFVPSHLLRTFNLRYLIASRRDRVAQALVGKAGGYQVHRLLGETVVYANADALPRAYFASRMEPFSFEAMHVGLLLNKAPPTTAYVQGCSESQGLASGVVLNVSYGASSINVDVAAPAGGFLVVSQRYEPGWRAWIDGVSVDIRGVNATLCGVPVPPGANEVILRYSSPGLTTGLCLGALGVLVLLAWLRVYSQ